MRSCHGSAGRVSSSLAEGGAAEVVWETIGKTVVDARNARRSEADLDIHKVPIWRKVASREA